jgi:hypothetical protein
MRVLTMNLWRVIEWITVMTTFGWLLANARTSTASPLGRKRRRTLRRRSGPAAATPPLRRAEITQRSTALT